MILFNKAAEVSAYIERQKEAGKKIGFVPTMGALHKGHLSLIEASNLQNDLTVCSIFVNPTQFNDPGDFRQYPVTIEQDIRFLINSDTDILFLPGVEEIYPNGTTQLPEYDLGYLAKILEGKFRPGHFQGVCQVMSRLLNIISPHHLFMGQKDYQQCMVVKQLIKIEHLNIIFHTCPTLREPEGLAMSSRNLRLNEEERQKATAIFRVLQYLKANLRPGCLHEFKTEGIRMLEKNALKPDYLEIADASTLEIADQWDGSKKLVALVAAFMREVRLIDNMIISE